MAQHRKGHKMAEDRKAYRNWKVQAANMFLDARKMENKGSKTNKAYCSYVKHFFFGDGNWCDFECETWKNRKSKLELPMSWTEWYVG